MLKGFPVKILSSALLLFKLRGKKIGWREIYPRATEDENMDEELRRGERVLENVDALTKSYSYS